MQVEHVIQYDFAKTVVDYVHRVGRTGRMGQKGKVSHFIRKADYDMEHKIREYEEKGEAFDKIINKKAKAGSKPHGSKRNSASEEEYTTE